MDECDEEVRACSLYALPGKHGTMYGMLLESVQHFVQDHHGDDSWAKVLEHAGLRNMVFSTHRRYEDHIMTSLAESCAAVIGCKSRDEYMCFFGQCFVDYFTNYGYDTIMRVSGRHYRDFLNGIDNLHETMRFSYPKMRSPSFFVSEEDRKGCYLHYRSKRVGFTHYVIGQLTECAKKFYSVEVEVNVISEKQTNQGCHVVFRLDFDNFVYRPKKDVHTYPALQEYTHISGTTFFKVFPFTVVFNEDMTIQHTGNTIRKLFQNQALVGQPITDCFILRRPQMNFTWQNILRMQRVVFELESLEPVGYRGCDPSAACACANGHIAPTRRLLLKGQMRYTSDLNGIAFLCTPLLSNVEEMQCLGLYIHDLNMYDSSRDMVMAGWQHGSRLEYSIEKQIEKSTQIVENLQKLDAWRMRSESLLYAMIPKQIAVRLRNGEDWVNTCETFDQVTIMFSYLIGFHELCAEVAPMQLVDCINSVFLVFDSIVDKYEVFKVETLGDAVYMVAGGVPDRRDDHATRVASVALELLSEVRHIQVDGARSKRLHVKIGMHTGGVVAGVVGKRTPQYCLFGDTVNTASRMQTYSQPGYIHISEPCQLRLDARYVTVFRGKVNIKGKGAMKTYWLAGVSEDPEVGDVCQNLNDEQESCLSPTLWGSESSFDLRRVRKASEVCFMDLLSRYQATPDTGYPSTRVRPGFTPPRTGSARSTPEGRFSDPFDSDGSTASSSAPLTLRLSPLLLDEEEEGEEEEEEERPGSGINIRQKEEDGRGREDSQDVEEAEILEGMSDTINKN